MVVFTFPICCLKCLVLILILCLCFLKKYADMKIRAEEKPEISGSYNVFVILGLES